MDVVGAKVVSLVSLFFLTLIFALLPIRMSSWSVYGGRYKRAAVSLASCFSGGIFLGVALLHLLPEVRETFEYVLCMKKVNTHYPITELTVAGGFLIILVFEQLVLLFHRPRPRSECDLANVPPHGCDRQRDCDNCRDRDDQSSSTEGDLPGSEGGRREDDDAEKNSSQSSSHEDSAAYSTSPRPSSSNGISSQPRYQQLETTEDQSSADPEARCTEETVLVEGLSNLGYQSNMITTELRGSHDMLSSFAVHSSDGTTVAIVDPNRQAVLASQGEATNANQDKTFTSLVLLAALSLHSLFEGLALGLQATSSSTIQIFIAVLFHKCVLAFALGVRMVKFNSSRKRIIQAAFIFAVMSPLGACIGIAVDATAANEVDRKLITACLQGLATGTFLFITFLEVIAHEIQTSRSPGDSDLQMMRLALIVVGFIIVSLVELYHDPDEHGGSTECSH